MTPTADERAEAEKAKAERAATDILAGLTWPTTYGELHAIVAYTYARGERDGFAACVESWTGVQAPARS